MSEIELKNPGPTKMEQKADPLKILMPIGQKKGGDNHFGYKANAGIDQGSELVRKISMTPAHVHDGNMLESALSRDEDWAFANMDSLEPETDGKVMA